MALLLLRFIIFIDCIQFNLKLLFRMKQMYFAHSFCTKLINVRNKNHRIHLMPRTDILSNIISKVELSLIVEKEKEKILAYCTCMYSRE